jgi:hypothetical protein
MLELPGIRRGLIVLSSDTFFGECELDKLGHEDSMCQAITANLYWQRAVLHH